MEQLKIEKSFPTNEAPPVGILKQLANIEYEIKGENNKLYNLKIIQNDNSIIFLTNEIGDLCNIIYKKELSLQEFYNSNRLFRQYISIDELFNLFCKNLKKSEIIISKSENKIKVSFIIEFRGSKDEIPFILEPGQLKIEDIIKNLCEKIEQLEKKEIENSNKNKELENKIKEKDIIIYKLIEKYNQLENEIEILKKSIFVTSEINSVIIKNNELNLIEEGIKHNFNRNIKRYELLLRGSIDGFSVNDFHFKCDGKDYTIALIETKNGRRFGGFTEVAWDQSDNWKKGSKSFIFSLDNREIYYIKRNADCIYCYRDSSNGLAFGSGHDFKLCNNCNTDNLSYDNSGKSYNTNGKVFALAGEKYFYVKDYEVYKIYLD